MQVMYNAQSSSCDKLNAEHSLNNILVIADKFISYEHR